MKSLKKYLIATSAGALLATGAGAETFDVTAEVSSTIALTETTALTLGSLYVSKGSGTDNTQATITLDADTGAVTSADGTEATTVSKVVSLGGATAGLLSVTGASPFTDITVTHGATNELVHESGNPSLPTLAFTTLDTTPANAGTLTLDANGDGDILVGGTFTVEAPSVSATAYADGVYTGSYEITVSY